MSTLDGTSTDNNTMSKTPLPNELAQQALPVAVPHSSAHTMESPNGGGMEPAMQPMMAPYSTPVNAGASQYPWAQPGFMTQDPGYQFRMDEGTKALTRAGSAGSGINNSGTQKALMRYGQNLASQEYSQARGRAIQDYNMRRQHGIQDYNLDRQAFFDQLGLDDRARMHAYQDQAYLDAIKQAEFDRNTHLAGMGFQGTNAAITAGLHIGDRVWNAAQYGAEGYGNSLIGAGRAGIQEADYQQEMYGNILSSFLGAFGGGG